jgi:hypothetical protein
MYAVYIATSIQNTIKKDRADNGLNTEQKYGINQGRHNANVEQPLSRPVFW